MTGGTAGGATRQIATVSGPVWVVTECYVRPAAPSHCAFAHRLMAGVARAGWDVRVLVPNGWFPPLAWRLAPAWRASARAHVPNGWRPDGVTVADLRYQNRVPSRLCRPLDHHARVAAALRRALADGGARAGRDVLLSQFALPYGPVVRAASTALGVPYAVHLRGDDVWLWSRRDDAALAAFLDVVRDAALVLGVSAALIDEARRLAGGALPPTAVVPNGIELDRFRPARSARERDELRRRHGLPGDGLVVLCSAQPMVRKGWAELLDALGTLARDAQPLELVAVIGSAPRVEVDVASEAARRAPGLRLRTVVDAAREQLAELLRAADIFVLPTHSEGMSNAVLEAMASGLPVITTAVGGHPEAITDGADGLLVPPRSEAALGATLARLIEDGDLRATLGRMARARAERIGDPRANGARLAALLAAVRDGTAGDQAALLAANPYGAPGEPAAARERSAAAHAAGGV